MDGVPSLSPRVHYRERRFSETVTLKGPFLELIHTVGFAEFCEYRRYRSTTVPETSARLYMILADDK